MNIVIGHRGTGKSHWLGLLEAFYKKKQWEALFFDLDQEIERQEGKSVFSLLEEGEPAFRQKEKRVFQQLIRSLPKDKPCFLSAGAGFVFKKQPSWNVIHLGRPSDQMGRVFLNRPRLNPSQGPFEEYISSYKKRSLYYLKQADEQFFRREYFTKLETSDLLFLGLKKLSRPYFSLRLNPQDAPKDERRLKLFLQKRLNWGLRFFELHDQTAHKGFIQAVRRFVPESRILFSSQRSKKFISVPNKRNWSWDLSLGPPPPGVSILALHERNQKSLKAALKQISAYKNYHLKLAVEIFNLEELKTAYDWQCEDTKNRSFLPRSKRGDWLWFRQAFGPKMLLHFIKGRSCPAPGLEVFSAPDQPFLSEAVPFIKPRKALAGALGDPIKFSATPAEHNSFFNNLRSIPVLPVPLRAEQMTKKNLRLLREFGFVFFAVTSPLKRRAFLSADICDKACREFKAVNTLIFQGGAWRAFNTDWTGSQELKKYSSKDTAVWGGGGTRPVLKKRLPLARFYSARRGKPLKGERSAVGPEQKNRHKNEQKKAFELERILKGQKNGPENEAEKGQKNGQDKGQDNYSPKILIWAVGRKRMERGCLAPPQRWKPLQVIDINYTADSPGLEYALRTQARYTSGMSFFKRQAKKQREIFKKIYNPAEGPAKKRK